MHQFWNFKVQREDLVLSRFFEQISLPTTSYHSFIKVQTHNYIDKIYHQK
jgi:ABC-type uncharacterized transport system permease subunit